MRKTLFRCFITSCYALFALGDDECNPEAYEQAKLGKSTQLNRCLDEGNSQFCACLKEYACFFHYAEQSSSNCVRDTVAFDVALLMEAVPLGVCDMCGLETYYTDNKVNLPIPTDVAAQVSYKQFQKTIQEKDTCNNFAEYSTEIADISMAFAACVHRASSSEAWCDCYRQQKCGYLNFVHCNTAVGQSARNLANIVPSGTLMIGSQMVSAPQCEDIAGGSLTIDVCNSREDRNKPKKEELFASLPPNVRETGAAGGQWKGNAALLKNVLRDLTNTNKLPKLKDLPEDGEERNNKGKTR